MFTKSFPLDVGLKIKTVASYKIALKRDNHEQSL